MTATPPPTGHSNTLLSARKYTGIKSKDIPEIWELVAPIIERALFPGDYTLEHIREELEAATMQLWVSYPEGMAVDACLVTRLENYPGQRVCILLLMAGKYEWEMAQFLALVEEWAREAGASCVRLLGRTGWERLLSYRKTGIILEKKL